MIPLIKRYILQFLKLIGLNKDFRRNVCKTRHPKNVLVCYLTFPFNFGVSYKHSNTRESLEIAKIFSELEYNVDIIQHNSSLEQVKRMEQGRYDVVFGIEPDFPELVKVLQPRKAIYYGTGAYFQFQNDAEMRRIRYLKERRGVEVAPRRQVPAHRSLEVADEILLIGNDWTKSTYEPYFSKPIHCVRVSSYSFFPLPEIDAEKNWDEASKHFLWFGSVGSVHKGLDLLLEIFKSHPDLHLYIGGNVVGEYDFTQLYKQELFETSNIHLEGWVTPSSSRFRELAVKCGFMLMPSCSEGMNGSVATCMRSGLVPIITRETGVDINNAGYYLDSDMLEDIEAVIVRNAALSAAVLREQAQAAHEQAISNNTIEAFAEDFREAIKEALRAENKS